LPPRVVEKPIVPKPVGQQKPDDQKESDSSQPVSELDKLSIKS
jgi:hypothetical protein